MLAQHLVVFTLIAASVLFLFRGARRTLRNRPGGLGNCCATGCSTPTEPKPQFIRAADLSARATALAARRRQTLAELQTTSHPR